MFTHDGACHETADKYIERRRSDDQNKIKVLEIARNFKGFIQVQKLDLLSNRASVV